MARRNVAGTISYDGTYFLGWQKSREGATIEGTLQEALEKVLQQPIKLQASSRTDAGVHAREQVVNFFIDESECKYPLERVTRRLNSLLPYALSVKSLTFVSDSFHPTLQVKQKLYRYYLCNRAVQLPTKRLYSWHLYHFLDLDKMREAASLFLGEKDFQAFSNHKPGDSYASTVRSVDQITITELEGDQIVIDLVGRNFLYKMVRNIVGTLVDVGRGRIEKEQIKGIFESKDRSLAGVTAPAHALFLEKVDLFSSY